MFSKKHFLFVSNFDADLFCESCIVQYNLFEDLEEERAHRMRLYDTYKDDPTLFNIIVTSLNKKRPTPIYYTIRISEKRKIAKYEKINLLFKEYHIRMRIRHHFIVNFIDTFQDKKHLFYITDFSGGGHLFEYLRYRKFFTKQEAIFYIAEIILAVQYFHSKGLLYRSLFPSNILVTSKGHIKLKFDFLNKQGLHQNEIFKNLNYISFDYLKYGNISRESDYWSIGVILYEMLFGFRPFEGETNKEIRKNVLEGPIYFPKDVNPETRNVLMLLLDRNKARRYHHFSNPDFIRRHPFFKNLNWELLANLEIIPPHHFPFPEPKNLIPLTSKFDCDYRPNETDGFHDLFEYYKEGQTNRFNSW